MDCSTTEAGRATVFTTAAGVPEVVGEIEEEAPRTLELTAKAAAPAASTPAIERVVAIPTFMMFSFGGPEALVHHSTGP